MSTARLCGYDVNGIRDLCARNWMVLPGEEEVFGNEFISRGGLFSAVVRLDSGGKDHWIGGKPAANAPHGRGDGWGVIGRSDKRIAVLDLLSGRADNLIALGGAFTGLAKGARINAVAIDEVASGSEEHQERLLSALAQARVANPMLIWRSVLAVLQYMTTEQVQERSVIGVVSHGVDGLRLQRLRILKQSGVAKEVLAPERRQAAVQVPFELDYSALARLARHSVLGGQALSSRTEHLVKARSVGKLVLGEPCAPELLRRSNGNWDILDAEGALKVGVPELSPEDFALLADCDVVLFESLSVGHIRDIAVRSVENALGRSVQALEPEAVAQGALEAARRISVGNPVFFDFLPKISTIVYAGGEPKNFDLIDDNETLLAGKLYRSPEPARLGLPGGQSEVSVYLHKEGQLWPRKATVSIGDALSADTPVSLFVEQKPVAGRARIIVDAGSIGRQFFVDWDQAEEIHKSWEEIIQDQDTFKPSIPNKLTLECSNLAWEESARSQSLYDVLTMNVKRDKVDWATLAQKLTARPNQTYCISSEGALPPEVDLGAEAQLNILTERALAETKERLSGKRYDDNEALKFLTWQFKRAPEVVGDMLLDCLSTRDKSGPQHPFILGPMSWVLIYYGAARIISGASREKCLIDAIFSRPIEIWRREVEVAALATLLSRSDTAPLAMTEDKVDRAAKRVLDELRRVIGTNYFRFLYIPFLLVGLLRYRLVDGFCLVKGHDPRVEELQAAIRDVLADLWNLARRDPKIERQLAVRGPLLEQILEELEGKGSNPDLLIDLFHAT